MRLETAINALARCDAAAIQSKRKQPGASSPPAVKKGPIKNQATLYASSAAAPLPMQGEAETQVRNGLKLFWAVRLRW